MTYALASHRTTTVATVPRRGPAPRAARERAGSHAATSTARSTSGSQTTPATITVPSIQISAGSRIWSIGAVTTHGSSKCAPSAICADPCTAPRWGEYQATISDDRERHADRDRTTDLTRREQRRSGRDERDAELRKRPRSEDARDAHRDDRPALCHARLASSAPTITTHIAQNARPVAARLSCDVEQERRDRREEEEQHARQAVDARVQPYRHEHDTGDEGDGRPQAKRDLRLADERDSSPSSRAP